MNETEVKLCPSSTCHEGAIVIGIRQGDDNIALLNYPMQVSTEFVQKAKEVGSPESRFRFADKCLNSGCKQWEHDKCGVIRELVEVNPTISQQLLPKCSIRPQCKWYEQEGAKACAICPFIVTNDLK